MQCTATQTGHHWGTGVHRLPEHTPRVHSHRGGCRCSQLWTQCAGCQGSAGGEGILTAGEKGDNDRSIVISEVIVHYQHLMLLVSVCQKQKHAITSHHTL